MQKFSRYTKNAPHTSKNFLTSPNTTFFLSRTSPKKLTKKFLFIFHLLTSPIFFLFSFLLFFISVRSRSSSGQLRPSSTFSLRFFFPISFFFNFLFTCKTPFIFCACPLNRLQKFFYCTYFAHLASRKDGLCIYFFMCFAFFCFFFLLANSYTIHTVK